MSEVRDKTERVDRYRLVTEYAGTAFGRRWAAVVAEGDETGRLVMVRQMPTAGLEPDALSSISRAAITAMVLRHPKIAAVLDVIGDDDQIAIVSEYVDGESLRSLQQLAAAKKSPLVPGVVLSILRDIVLGLAGARDQWRQMAKARHDTPTESVHGGVTPDVVLLANFGEALLCDVGVAGSIARVPRLLRHPDSVAYRAPEQLTAEHPVDGRADVFSLGVIAWELLANRPLFGPPDRFSRTVTAAEATTIEKAIVDERPPPLDSIPRQGTPIPSQALVLVTRALSKNPADRFASLDGMAHAIENMPKELFASPDRVAAAVDRLARSRIDARRGAIEIATGSAFDRDTNSPASKRSTERPPAPDDGARITLPQAIQLSMLGAPPPRFPDTEAPTAKRRTPGPRRPAPPRPADTSPEPAAEVSERISVEPISVEPISIEPEIIEAEPEAVEPEAAEPKTVEPKTVEPKTVEPETAEPETAEPEVAEDSATADFFEPEVASAPEVSVDAEADSLSLQAIAAPQATRTQRSRTLALVIAAAAVLIGALALVRVLTREKPNDTGIDPAPSASAAQTRDAGPAPAADDAAGAATPAPDAEATRDAEPEPKTEPETPAPAKPEERPARPGKGRPFRPRGI